MAESELVLRRLLASPDRLHAILLSREKATRLHPTLARAGVTCPVYVAALPLISEIAGFHVHRGVLATGRRQAVSDLTVEAVFGTRRGTTPLTLVLAAGLTNVDNMGALFRNAAAFGVDGLILDPTCCDPLYRKAIRVSMGHALSLPFAVSGAWPEALIRLREEWGMTLVAAEVTPEARPVVELPRSPRLGLVFGSEGEGLSDAVLGACDAICAIPMAPGVSSLNVAVASAVFLYELGRGRGDKTAGNPA
ncbi:MAG: RNA methyltransferase [Phycisphaerales bacterium]|nr:RNA methyltransferase [Phycisphaerae bacterium]NNF41526.1 RNA methyltransferase [Phycisphaerales bacterium]NNM26631.1 RNA methyltransferase [Phycisphaerales bacterium]